MSDEQTKNRLLNLWSKFHYRIEYKVELKHYLFHIYFYSILEKKM